MEEEIDPNKVYFQCSVCNFVFQENPFMLPIKCPQCGAENPIRI
jgi:predicted Zn-ribbon and HTH transcriptional regulator